MTSYNSYELKSNFELPTMGAITLLITKFSLANSWEATQHVRKDNVHAAYKATLYNIAGNLKVPLVVREC